MHKSIVTGTLILLLSGLFYLYASDLQTFSGVTLIPTDWADGDSFRVQLPDGREQTLRLYGADCLEWHVTDSTDARRLRAQRRYFGISNHGGNPQASIKLAKTHGEAAASFIEEALARPFTIHTAFADGRGDERYSRIYAFVETPDGNDLATLLVANGLARAYGVYRTTAEGTSRDDYREQLKDAELVAARNGKGIWAFTNWEALPQERRAQRREEAEIHLALGTAPPRASINVNTATREDLQRVPGIGPATADRIMEARPFKDLKDLTRVHGIGPATQSRIEPYLKLSD